ncbi:MAG: glycosyltransferase family 2 protein [Chloroflexota bacterium]|nr:glycosyltransferase family 2 protein [Chloroflexota bacterium]
MSDGHGERLVSVIIPAKDEAGSLGRLIPGIKESLNGYPYEIIVVDDGSRDGTRDIARNNGIVVLFHERNRGKGAAMKTGVGRARGEVLVFIDGDTAHDPRDIPVVMAPILEGRADLVIGSRAFPESRVVVSPFVRRVSNALASAAISVICSLLLPLAMVGRCPFKRIRITDCTSGFRAVRREGWQRLCLESEGFQIETEMIYEAARNGLAITEAPIGCNWSRELSRLSIVRDGTKTLGLLTRKLVCDALGAGPRRADGG